MEKFVIIDGNSLINRAFYGLPPLKSLSGKQCGAVYGFVNMMISVITQEKPKYLVCVFDAGKHTFRHDMYAEYKGTREGMPEDLCILQDNNLPSFAILKSSITRLLSFPFGGSQFNLILLCNSLI